jgi:hypothetical protein
LRERPLLHTTSGRVGVQTRSLAETYSRSMMVTFAVPPPSHIVCSP